ncbi:hypothetical protein MNBD_GAMMA21-2611 [hydrothermal vent metagenome]|uniref:Uncharacterized protein n=1 Tax=hydrothermal vent metagenome TaxID=652676 RepID=A0A3B1A6J3_9ZZZZ
MTSSQEDDVRFVTKFFFGFECHEISNTSVVSVAKAKALAANQSCSKALGLVPLPTAFYPASATKYLIGVAQQLRRGNYSLLCNDSNILKWRSVLRMDCKNW